MNSRASAPSRTRWSLLARFCFRSALSASSASSGLSSTSSISTAVRFMLRSSFRGKGEVEGGAAVDRPLGPHVPTVPLNDPLHDGETHPGALELLGAVKPLEDLEQLVGKARVESHTIVADEVRRCGSLGAPDLDRRLAHTLAELEGVADQVDEELLQHPAVAAGRRQVADADRDEAVGLRPLQRLADGPGARAHVARHAFELLAAEPREGEQVVDEPPHLPHVVANDPEEALAIRIEGARMLLREQPGEAVDGPQRRAQVVRHGVAERFQLLVLPLEIGEQGSAGVRELAGRPTLRGFHLLVEQFLADAAVLVLEVFSPELRAQSRLQHLEVRRLRDVIVRAGIDALDHRLLLLESREHDQGNVPPGWRVFDAPTGLLSGQPRHHEVEQDALDRLHGEQLESLLARARQHDVVALVANLGGERLEVRRAVIDGEYLLRVEETRGGVRPCRRPGASQDRPQAGENDADVLLLADEVVRPRVERA